ncbi:MAG: DUF4349 domain-containing protein [Gemmatimonadetes bacterium]|nr:DUF4349 domain-containing protein [Gemmatimonadota bacterium]MCC6772219.1 DUF4349 domain-containing protein [Gemmatimonadaceae bacterium]
MSSRIARFAPVAVLVLSALVACGQSVSSENAAAVAGRDEAAKLAAPAESDMMSSRQVGFAAAPSPEASQPGGQLPPSTSMQPGSSAESMIIRTGSASLEVDSLELAIAAVQRIAASVGGWVGNTSLSSGDYEVRRATLELKIPASRYDEALAGLTPIGKVESVSSNAEDVGEEFVDLTARTTNARRLEERLITLLATRTGKLEDVLNVERELARVREEIERYDGRLRYLRSRIATSTLSVTVHERAPLVSVSPGENVIGEAFKDAWRNFVRFTAALIASLGTLIPLLALVVLAALGWRKFGAPRFAMRVRTVKEEKSASEK